MPRTGNRCGATHIAQAEKMTAMCGQTSVSHEHASDDLGSPATEWPLVGHSS